MPTANNTIYLNNLTEKLSKEKLRRQLYNICSRFGPILDVIVHTGSSMRGQAWIVFSNVESATKAISKLNDYVFFEKPVRASFAKENSDIIAKLSGTYVARPKKRKKAVAEDNQGSSSKKQQAPQPKKKGKVEEVPSVPPMTAVTAATTSGGGHDSNNPPGPILKIDSLPEDITKDMLISLFSQNEGFVEVRYVLGKGVAFIEYKNTEQAKSAREKTKGHMITPTHRLHVLFAKAAAVV